MQLADYLKSKEISDDDFARLIGVNRQAVHRYKTFQRFPKREVLARIFEATEGAVTANDLVQATLVPADSEKSGAV